MKVVIADPPMQALRYTQAVSSPNIGILYLISYLRKTEPDVKTYYIEPYLSLKQHLEKLKEISPDVYGISFATLLKENVYKTIKHVRKLFPKIPIFCGGAHPSAENWYFRK